MTAKDTLNTVILEDPLYKKRAYKGEIPLTYIPSLDPLNFRCAGTCDSTQTFAVSSVDNGQQNKYFEDLDAVSRMSAASMMSSGHFPGPRMVDNEAIYQITLQCLKCRSYNVNFILHFQPIKDDEGEITQTLVQKVGQLPSVEDTLDSELEKWLTRDDKELYKKGVRCEAHGFGIGAYGYFRRVLEGNVLRILEEISSTSDNQELVASITKAKEQHTASERLEIVKDHAPKDLMPLGQNVFVILYKALSKGLHKGTDEECLDAATNIRTCLGFIIKKLYRAKADAESLKNALKSLN